jgi:anaerobic magnesium-protoporphyrin IX monomethyl ester cyclase
VKVLLVVKSKFMESLGVMYLSSVVKLAGHECRIVALPELFKTVVEWRPDVIGLSIMTGDRERFYAEIEKLYESRKTIFIEGNLPKIIVGGPDPTFFPEGYDWADEVVSGEGEVWAWNLTHENIGIMKTMSIDSLPWPDRTDFQGFKIRDFITSRGCPYSCTYCFNARWNRMFPDQKQVRVRSVDDVIAELLHVKEVYGMEYAYFQDSCFAVNMDWMREFAEKYAIYIQLPYQCHFRPEQINEERVELLKKSGCVAVRIALESASNRLRSLIGRHKTRLDQVRVASELLQGAGIQLMLQNILGLPHSTIEDDLFTLEMNIKYKPTYAWASIFVPYPGTDLGDMCKETGLYGGDYSEISDSFFDTSYLNFEPEHKEQLEILQKVFALCVEMEYLPTERELTYKNLPKLIHKITRGYGDRKLYLGLL